ncbi:hypothetical protein E4U11_007000 [Claviceps purpurea]|nr:hypothetical protein E4U11_007000 [Claviceps purpurea]
MASSQDEFLSPEGIAPTTQHEITRELPQSIRRFDKEISSEWKRGCIDPDSASPQDATYWMANRVRAYTDKTLTLDSGKIQGRLSELASETIHRSKCRRPPLPPRPAPEKGH